MNKPLAVAIIVGLGVVGLTTPVLATSPHTPTRAPASAAKAHTSASWNANCTSVTTTSTKDISNVVYRVDGVDTKIELGDGIQAYELPGAAIDVWIKSGNNHSGDGPGYGEHHPRPSRCASGGGPQL